MLRIGLIGAGRIAHVHARSIASNPDATLSIVADVVLDSAKSLAASQGARATDDIDSVFTDDQVDALIICSPTPLHVEHIVKAARVGKPALCEKPVALDSSEVEKLHEQLEGLDPVIMMGFNRRFDPSFHAIHDMVEAGDIGDLEQVTIISRDPAAPPKSYIAVSGGIFKDMTIHDFDTARYFLGDIATVSAVGQNMDPELADTGDYDGAVVTLVNTRGTVATITNSRHCAPGYDQRPEAFGSKGVLNADNVRPTTVRRSTSEVSDAQDPYLDFFLTRYEQAYTHELTEFIAAISEGRRPSPGIEDGAKALRLAEAAEQAARTGTVVAL